jgi:hypothetical protein
MPAIAVIVRSAFDALVLAAVTFAREVPEYRRATPVEPTSCASGRAAKPATVRLGDAT